MFRSLAFLALVAGAQARDNGRHLSESNVKIVDDAKNFLSEALSSVRDFASKAGDKMRFSLEDVKNGGLADILGGQINTEDLFSVDRSAFDGLKNAQSFDDAWDAIEDIEGQYCTGPEFTPSEKVPTTCKGPEIELEFEPKTCKVDSTGHSIDCKPARLVLRKIPGKCTYKHHTASVWEGKSCKITKKFGKEQEIIKGGDEYFMYFDKHNITKPW